MTGSSYETFLLRGEALPASNVLVVPEFESSAEWTGVWAHEYFHFLQFCGTGAGRQIGWMFAQLGHSVSAFLRDPPNTLRAASVWRFPILAWCADERDARLRSELRKHFSFLIFTGDTLELFLGWLPFHVRDNQWSHPSSWPWSTRPPESRILPELTTGGRTEPFGAFHIMETAAAIQGLRMEDADVSLGHGRMGFSITQPCRDLLKRMLPHYSVGVRWIENNSNIPEEMVVAAAALAADIALNCHIETLEDAGTDGVKWEDWHPGWRFIKAVSAIEALILTRNQWPSSDTELADYCEEIRKICNWPEEPNRLLPLPVFEKTPSRSDHLRQCLAEEARVLRRELPSLWSIGPRENIMDVSFKRFKPPVLMHYGRDTISTTRPDVNEQVLNDLWVDTQLHHIAWQIIRRGSAMEAPHLIECFPWSKEGHHNGCELSNGVCRWFPAPKGKPLPESCPMLRTLRDLCGDYWDRLRPMQ